MKLHNIIDAFNSEEVAKIWSTPFRRGQVQMRFLCILIQVSLKYVPKGSVDYKLALVQIMAWRLIGDKPYHGPLAWYVKLWVAHAPGMPGTFSPPLWVSDPDMHHGTCVTHVTRCMPGSLTSVFLLKSVAGKTFPAFPTHAQPTILRIWQEAHGPITA